MIKAQPNNFLLIHGAYHGAWCWDEVKRDIESKGAVVYAIDLPGHGLDMTNRRDVDIETYVAIVEKYIEQNNLSNLTLVGHSFGGVVITKLIEKIPSKIKNIVFVTAVILDYGEAFFDYFPESVRERYSEMAEKSDDNSIRPNPESLRIKLFNDLNDDKKFQNIVLQLTPQPIKPYMEKVFLKDFKRTTIPVYYIFCKNDISLPQETFSKMLSKLPPNYTRIDINSDHEVMFSHPKELAEILIKI